MPCIVGHLTCQITSKKSHLIADIFRTHLSEKSDTGGGLRRKWTRTTNIVT
jgi:hypothetical protein